eukprot:SAG11_NODE_144_length_14830_cov_17.955943_5_plen_237_part_00
MLPSPPKEYSAVYMRRSRDQDSLRLPKVQNSRNVGAAMGSTVLVPSPPKLPRKSKARRSADAHTSWDEGEVEGEADPEAIGECERGGNRRMAKNRRRHAAGSARDGLWDTKQFRHDRANREGRLVEDEAYWRRKIKEQKQAHKEEEALSHMRWETKVRPWLDKKLAKRPTQLQKRLRASRREQQRVDKRRQDIQQVRSFVEAVFSFYGKGVKCRTDLISLIEFCGARCTTCGHAKR